MHFLTISLSAVAAYCLVRGLADYRERRFAWSIVGFACAGLLILTPIPTAGVTQVDVYPASPR